MEHENPLGAVFVKGLASHDRTRMIYVSDYKRVKLHFNEGPLSLQWHRQIAMLFELQLSR